MKYKSVIFTLLALCLIFSGVSPVFAEQTDNTIAPEVLLIKAGKTITIHTTIDEVREMFGPEKLKTISIFGGNSYTFYGEDYSDYLYLETNMNGQIVAYNTIGTDFICGKGSSNKNIFMFSRIIDPYKDGNVIGALGGWYPPELLSNQYKPMEVYKTDAAYAIAIAQHTVPMWNAISKNFGMNDNIRFDERTFYISRQLTENNSNLDEYCQAIEKGSYFNAIYSGGYTEYLMNDIVTPLTYAASAAGYHITENEYAVFDRVYGEERNQLIIGGLDPAFYEEHIYIPYTEEEQTLLENARKIYAESVEVYNSADKYFVIHPQYDVLPLEPGVINEACLLGATGYINAIRAGAGLPLLEHDPKLSEACQYKVALTRYLAINGIPNPNPHLPPQPEGISDEYFAKAQYGDGENLFIGDVIKTITYALDDSYGDSITCGHRHTLLSPYAKYFGVGSSEIANNISYGIQGVQKFSDYQDSDEFMVGWPSKGIMLAEALGRDQLMCTALFYNTYKPTADTGVIFTCLNTGKSIEFEAGMDNSSEKELHINATTVSYFSRDINLVIGNVYQITITNLLNETTGQLEDYTYRSVFETASISDTKAPNSLTLDRKELQVDLNEQAKLYAVIEPRDADNKMVSWSSDNKAVAIVNENGYVTGISYGTATITAKTDNGISSTCTVTVEKHTHTEVIDKAVDATCNTEGKTEGKHCSVCHTVLEKQKTIPATGHDWDEWKVTKPATGAEMGEEKRTCTICGQEETRSIDKLKNPFVDVPAGKFYETAVLWAVEKGITNGMDATHFAPDATCNRGQVVTFLWRAAGSPEPTSTNNPFTDVVEGKFYYKAVLWAVENGITNGMTATTFGTDQPCTRGQVATFLWRTLNEPAASSSNKPFTDVAQGKFYYDAVLWAAENGVTSGMTKTTFAPDATCTRGQIVTFLYRALG